MNGTTTPQAPHRLRPISTSYAGVTFRSRLEADWAYTLDAWRIPWSYEPEGIALPNGQRYLPDFWLPNANTWLEVKGPGVPGLDKTDELVHALAVPDDGPMYDSPPQRGDYGWCMQQCVVIASPAIGIKAMFNVTCRYCGRWMQPKIKPPYTSSRACIEGCQDCGATCFVTYDQHCGMESRCWTCGGKTSRPIGDVTTFHRLDRGIPAVR